MNATIKSQDLAISNKKLVYIPLKYCHRASWGSAVQ